MKSMKAPLLAQLRVAIARWQERPRDTYAVHLHHLDPSFGPTRNEIVTRLELSPFDPAIRNDVASIDKTSLAEQIDAKNFAGMQPLGSFAARTIPWISFAFNDALQGEPEELWFTI